jgi:hypothetical protein
MESLPKNPSLGELKKAREDLANGRLTSKRFRTKGISNYTKQGGSNAERVIEAAILAERLGSRIQESSQIFQRGISRILSQSTFGWKENIISSLKDEFGEPLKDPYTNELIQGKDTHAVWHLGNDAYKLVRLWDGQELEGLTKQIMLNARFGERYSGDVLGGGTVDGKLYILVKQPWIERGVADRYAVREALEWLMNETGLERAPNEDGYINEKSFSPYLQDDKYVYSDLNLNQNYFVTEDGDIRIIDADVEYRDTADFMSAEFDPFISAARFDETKDDIRFDTSFSHDYYMANNAEYREVYNRYHNSDGTPKFGYRKAPNGKTSKLTEEQWNLVRTLSFKKWFGDWEAANLLN